ncbi:hypothetical protein SAMN04488018_103183 [Myroides marinus]|uniref:Uncharacterized protein n=1 Tax=Myroides marinus TaxID=703342 RepID=A0A165R2M7_9FLAO|nr:hypothetical protein [Myroides marinus]KZE78062.1 hypothetical protein AV926_13550 [Myroides marinus]MDM1346703.1 hypothetical protein [Myroides marinus]SEI71140.1 hypothetical protein SAMN04488018_103183 [Myroides marinus]
MNITHYKKRYNELSKQFREIYNNHDISIDLFDLLYELQAEDQTVENKTLQCHIYALLEYWQTAYKLLLEVSDSNDSKVKSKLFVFSEKAKTYKDTFGLKDVRKTREKKEVPILSLDDFIEQEEGSNQYNLNTKRIVVFNQYCPTDRFKVSTSSDLSDMDKLELIEYLHWLTDLRSPLIEFYNSDKNGYLPFIEGKADDHWYDTLEIYSTNIRYFKSGHIETTISMGDQLITDHIIDLVIDNKVCVEMNFDG